MVIYAAFLLAAVVLLPPQRIARALALQGGSGLSDFHQLLAIAAASRSCCATQRIMGEGQSRWDDRIRAKLRRRVVFLYLCRPYRELTA